MKYSHFETFQPHCPVCKNVDSGSGSRLVVGLREVEDAILLRQGTLICSNPLCQHEFPVIDGIPIIVANLREYIAASESSILRRTDLSENIESIIGDSLGSGSVFDVNRQHLSSYVWAHYGDKIIENRLAAQQDCGSYVQLINQSLENCDIPIEGPSIDLGCSVGRATFELAERTGDLSLGIDLNFNMLRFASQLLSGSQATFPKRRVGLAFDDLKLDASFENSNQVDFWACDAAAVPIKPECCASLTSLNLLDAVSSPYDHLLQIAGLLKEGGVATLCCPYDWSTAVTAEAAWIGGHSQRGPFNGASESILRSILEQPPLRDAVQVVGEEQSIQWQIRLHDRSVVHYDCHSIELKKHVKATE